MPIEDPNSLAELKEKFLSEDISQEDLTLLRALLTYHKDEVEDLRKSLLLQGKISSSKDLKDESFLNGIMETIKEIEAQKKKNIIPLFRTAAIAAAVLLLAGLSLFYSNRNTLTEPPIASVIEPSIEETLVVEPQLKVADVVVGDTQSPLYIGDTVSKEEGLHKIIFDNGTVASLEAPFSLTILAPNEILLKNGLLAVHCPTDKSNLSVKKGSSIITDLGTAFVVDARGDDLEVDVLSGEISITTENAQRNFTEGEAVKFIANTESNTPFTPFTSDREKYRKLFNTISPEEQITLPNNVELVNLWELSDKFTGNKPLQLTFEAGGITLTGDGSVNETPGSVSAYLLRALPVGGDENAPTHIGEITFEKPILKLMSKEAELYDFEIEQEFSHLGSDIPMRGYEGVGNLADSFTLSADRKTLSFRLFTHTTLDDLRIFIEEE